MSRGERGPGYSAHPRYPVYRATDLVGPATDPATVRATLTARDIAVVDRDQPVGRRVVAVVGPTSAGTVITLQRRGDLRNPRSVVRRRLTAILEDLVQQLENPTRDPAKS